MFTGFQIPNNIKLNQLNLEAATQDLEKAKNDIRTQVAQAYVQILYDMEMADVALRQISIDSAQVARLQALLNIGSVISSTGTGSPSLARTMFTSNPFSKPHFCTLVSQLRE